jgi:hypothetical protein
LTEAPQRVLFLGGLGRSGSTLLELILAQSPDVCALGEVVHLWERALLGDESCGCGERFSACPFWVRVGEKAFGSWSTVDADSVLALKARVDRTRYLPRLSRRRLSAPVVADLRRYTEFYTQIYRAAAAVSGAEVVVDSSKHASLAYALDRATDVDLRVLHLVRDSRAVAHSWAKQVRRPEVRDTESYMPRFSPLHTSLLYTVQNTAFDRLGRRRPVTRLRYEDFIADPAAAIGAVRALAGLPERTDAAAVLHGAPPQAAHTVAGNPLRFTAGPLRVRNDDGWRTGLPRRRRLLVGAATLPLRLRYGYIDGRELQGEREE